jgi:hypothetical protein
MGKREQKTQKEEPLRKILLLGVVLTLVVVLAVPMAASAATATDTCTVSGEVTATYTIEVVPDTVSLGQLSNSADATSASLTITVSTTDTGSGGLHHVTVAVKGADGKLSAGGTILTPALQINSPTIGWSDQNIGTTDQAGSAEALDASSGSAQVTDVTIKQPAVTTPNPIPAGTYQETITFTATFGS